MPASPAASPAGWRQRRRCRDQRGRGDAGIACCIACGLKATQAWPLPAG